MIEEKLNINTRTSGFASPAESYVTKRLDINELIIDDVHTTFYFRYDGPDIYGLRKGNVIVVDRAKHPKEGEIVVLTREKNFIIDRFNNQPNLWGRISWVLKKQ